MKQVFRIETKDGRKFDVCAESEGAAQLMLCMEPEYCHEVKD